MTLQKAIDVVLQAPEPQQYATLNQIYKRIIHSDLISFFADYFRFLLGPEVFFQTPKEEQSMEDRSKDSAQLQS